MKKFIDLCWAIGLPESVVSRIERALGFVSSILGPSVPVEPNGKAEDRRNYWSEVESQTSGFVELLRVFGWSRETGLSVRGKIFALACALIVLFAVIVSTSLAGLFGVHREMRVLTEVLQPLDHYVARMTLTQTESGAALIERLDAIDPGGIDGISMMREDLRVHADGIRQTLKEFAQEFDAADPYLVPFKSRNETLRLRQMVENVKQRGTALANAIDRLGPTIALGRPLAYQRAAIRAEDMSLSFVESLAVLEEVFDAIEDRAAIEAERHEQHVTTMTGIFAILIAVVAVTGSFYLSRLITDPLARLVAVAREVEAGRLDVKAERASRDELGWLTDVFNDMIRGLRTKERIKSTFGKYVDPRVVDHLITEEQEALASTVRPLTVLRTRHTGFSGMAASLSTEELVDAINHYFTSVSKAVFDQGGVVDAMHGDTVLAFFGPPFQAEDKHFRAACEAALIERAHGGEARPENAREDTAGDAKLHVTLCVGPCIVGTMGSDISKTFTVMGENVALTPQLLDACHYYGTSILVAAGEEPANETDFVFREVDYVEFPSHGTPVRLFELVGRRGEVDDETVAFLRRYEEGAAALRDRRWTDANTALAECLELRPGDKPTQLLAERLDLYSFDPPPEDWNGAWGLTES